MYLHAIFQKNSTVKSCVSAVTLISSSEIDLVQTLNILHIPSAYSTYVCYGKLSPLFFP